MAASFRNDVITYYFHCQISILQHLSFLFECEIAKYWDHQYFQPYNTATKIIFGYRNSMVELSMYIGM